MPPTRYEFRNRPSRRADLLSNATQDDSTINIIGACKMPGSDYELTPGEEEGGAAGFLLNHSGETEEASPTTSGHNGPGRAMYVDLELRIFPITADTVGVQMLGFVLCYGYTDYETAYGRSWIP